MRLFIRYFFRTAQYIIGPIILLWDKTFPPRAMIRPAAEQQEVDTRSKHLVLYQFRMCPYCVKARRAIKRLSLNIETRDALRESSSREELLAGGGKIKVPCLRIADEDGNTTWMYESSDIITYLQGRFA